jgi:hypothetical protein
MAVTKIIPIRSTIQKSVDYICNPDKTDGSLLIHSEHCFQQTAGLTFNHHLNKCRAGGNTIGRHLIQSFAPGEVDPSAAHEIGKKLAAEILGGEYAYVLATHVDRGHVHNHFIWGAANIKTHKRYRSNKGTYHAIREKSDRLCKENRLSVIVQQGENKSYGKSYGNHYPEKTSSSYRDKLKAAIDNLIPRCGSFEDLLTLMESQGYKIKRGKHISFQAPGQERFTRSKSLGEGYAEEEIKSRIANKEIAVSKKKVAEPSPQAVTAVLVTPPVEKLKEIKPFLDIAGNPKFAESRGLEQWAKIQNLKNLAAAFSLVQEYGGMDAFMELCHACRIEVETIENGIEANNEQIKAWGYLRKDIETYKRTMPVYRQYREMKRAKNNITFFGKDKAEEFRRLHEDDISDHELARAELKGYERPLYSNAAINAEIEKIKAANVRNKKGLTQKKSELSQFGKVHSYLFDLDRQHRPKPERQQQRTRSRSNDISL